MRYKISIFIVLASFLTIPVRAQTAPSKDAKNLPAYVTVIALGAEPKKRYKLEEKAGPTGDRLPVLLPSKKGEHPPASLYYKTEKKDGKQQYGKIRVGFNNPSGINKIKPNRSRALSFRDEEAGANYQKFMDLPPMIANTQTLFLLSQKSKKLDRWLNKPTVTRIALNYGELKEAKLYMKNLSSETVYVKINKEEPHALKKGEGKMFEHSEASAMIRLLAMKKENSRERKLKKKVRKPNENPDLIPIMRTGTRLNDNMLTVFAFYDADPYTNSGKTVGVCRTVTKRLKLTPLEEAPRDPIQ